MNLPKMRLEMTFGTRGEFLAIMLLLIAIANFVFTRTIETQEHLEQVAIINNIKADFAISMKANLMANSRDLNKLFLLATEAEITPVIAGSKARTAEYSGTEEKLNKFLANSPITTTREKAAMVKIKEAASVATPIMAKVESLAMVGKGKDAAIGLSQELQRGPMKAWLDALTEIIDLEHEQTSQVASEASAYFDKIRMWVFALMIIVILFGVGLAWWTVERNKQQTKVS